MKGPAFRAAGAAVFLAAAVVLVLIALDAHAWGSRFPADDLRFRRDPTVPRLWKPHELSPFGLDRALLGIDDDLEYRRAVRTFRVGRPLELLFTLPVTTRRVEAQIDLSRFAQESGDPKRRSQAENLMGVLGFAMATQDAAQRTTFLNDSITHFRRAIALDAGNDDAFFNLEYALGQLTGSADLRASGANQAGGQGSAGLKNPGQGY